MSIGAFCRHCNSAFCNHALQINEHNIRMEYDRRMGGMIMQMAPEITAATVKNNSVTSAKKSTKVAKDKKLLLLRRGK